MAKTGRPKISLYIVLIVVVLVGAGILVYRKYKYEFVQQKLTQAVDSKNNGIYRLQYEHLVIDEVAGSITADHILLQADTAAYLALQKTGKQPPVLLNLTIPSLSISGVKTPKALLSKEVQGDKILLSNAVIEIYVNNFFRDSSRYAVGEELYKQILGKLKSIRIGSIELAHTRIDISDLLTHKKYFTASDLTLSLTDLAIDSLHAQDSSRIFFARDLAISGKDLTLPTKNHDYDIRLTDFGYNSATASFGAKQLRIQPRLGETAFAAHAKISKDRYDFRMDDIRLIKIDRKAMLEKKIEADSLTIAGSSFKIYRDISYPRDSIVRINTYPHQKLQSLALPLYIRKIVLNHSFIEYKERNGKSDTSGKLQFYDVRAIFTHMTNMPVYTKNNDRATLDFTARFLNKARFHAVMTMYLLKNKGRFDLTADLGPMAATDVNPMTEPMALARIDKGQIDGLHYDLKAGDSAADGKLNFRYHDLKVSLLKKKDNQPFKKKFLPSLAAGLLIKDSNPAKGELRMTDVHYKRDIHRSMFNLMWKSLFTGIKQTAGAK